MAKLSVADKMAQKAFFNPQFQQSWQVHMKAFGPILEPAFRENYQAKVHLCAALNHISTKNIPQALLKLKQMDKHCVTDADKTAMLFFMGLFCEAAGNQEQMIALYAKANESGHRFYLPYMKVAKYSLDTHDYGTAEENYRAAIRCFDATGLGKQDKLLLGSAYTNLASCLTMMHRYEEAEEALETSRSLYPDAPGRAAVEATLFAVRGDAEQANARLEALKAFSAEAYALVRKGVDKILAGTDPMFFTVPVEEEKITAFWSWFQNQSSDMKQKLDRQEYAAVIDPVARKLLETFPFLEEVPYVGLGKNEKGYVLELKDLYAVGIIDAYKKLLTACPEAVKEHWQFAVVH